MRDGCVLWCLLAFSFHQAEEGKPFWVSPVKQPESLFMDAPPELMVRRQDLAKFVRAKVGKQAGRGASHPSL